MTAQGLRADRMAIIRNSGSTAVAIGLVVLGLSSYGFLSIGARAVTTAEFSIIAVLWSTLFALANGLFSPLEQEVTRAVAERVERGEAIAPVVARVAMIGGAAAATLSLLLLIFRAPVANAIFGGRSELVAVLALGLLASAAVFITRGVLAGTGRYWGYAGQLGAEGLLRVCAVIVLAVVGWAGVDSLGLVVALPPVIILLGTLILLPRRGGGARASSWGEVSSRLGWLIVAAAFSQGVSNAGPVVLQLIDPKDRDLAGRFFAAFIVVRIPIFFSTALQASLLPRLVRAAERRDRGLLIQGLGRALALVAGLGAVSLAGLALLGPWLVSSLFGAKYQVQRGDLLVLCLSSVLLVAATLLQSAALALQGHRAVAGSWAASGLVFVLGCLLPLSPALRIEVAYLAWSLVIVALLCGWLWRRLRERGNWLSPADLHPVITR